VLSASTVQADRTLVAGALNRSEVASQLQLLGVDNEQALQRVAAMTDNEVHALAGNLTSLPAGAMWDGGWILLLVIVGIAVYFAWK